uniref:Uncharacterized protein n=1 Tax=Lactuca sativa TaxID=4236 RepID=A0A9R1VS50_LACSA|nr:hypothetical protein LSAT_V11C400182210 [Lactuca sativa]
MQNKHDNTCEVVVTTTCRLEPGHEIMACLQHTPQYAAMFRASYFGAYVNMSMGVECHHSPCHYLTCKEYSTCPLVDLKELLFQVHNYRVWFKRKAFCLMTGLRFDDYFPTTSSLTQFKHYSVKVVDIMQVSNDSLYQLEDADVVRVSLMYMLEHGFYGRYPRQEVNEEYLTFVYNLAEFNRVILDFNYRQLSDVFDKTKELLNPTETRVSSRPTYIAQGFVYALKLCPLCFIIIWIMETLSNNSIVGTLILGVIPWVITYPRMRQLHVVNCECILDVINC